RDRRNDHRDAALAGWTGLTLSLVILTGIALAIDAAAMPIVSLYTDDPALRRLADPVVGFIALVIVLDGGQGVMAGAVRGRGGHLD
ncbi:MAG: MATE family efflux transporter, partial [Rhodospirillales bacterium]|nr:MATE family efflux transporter [Rhodospirillales bacterium]